MYEISATALLFLCSLCWIRSLSCPWRTGIQRGARKSWDPSSAYAWWTNTSQRLWRTWRRNWKNWWKAEPRVTRYRWNARSKVRSLSAIKYLEVSHVFVSVLFLKTGESTFFFFFIHHCTSTNTQNTSSCIYSYAHHENPVRSISTIFKSWEITVSN